MQSRPVHFQGEMKFMYLLGWQGAKQEWLADQVGTGHLTAEPVRYYITN